MHRCRRTCPRGHEAAGSIVRSGQRAGLPDGRRQPPPKRMRPVSTVDGAATGVDDFILQFPFPDGVIPGNGHPPPNAGAWHASAVSCRLWRIERTQYAR
jgi:hypothetical protein